MFIVVRINRDPSDTYALERRPGQLDEQVVRTILDTMALPDPGAHVDFARVLASDAGEARLYTGLAWHSWGKA